MLIRTLLGLLSLQLVIDSKMQFVQIVDIWSLKYSQIEKAYYKKVSDIDIYDKKINDDVRRRLIYCLTLS